MLRGSLKGEGLNGSIADSGHGQVMVVIYISIPRDRRHVGNDVSVELGGRSTNDGCPVAAW